MKDLAQSRIVPVIIGNTTGSMVFESDTDSLYFVENDLYKRAHKVYRYSIQKNTKSLIYEETDQNYYLTRKKRIVKFV